MNTQHQALFHHQFNCGILTRSATQEVRNPLMISISSAIYGFLLQQVRALIKDDGREQCTDTLQSEPDEVYLRFGGGALADMFKQHYKDMKSKKPSASKERISQELQVLECMRRVDKSTLPPILAETEEECTFLTRYFCPLLEAQMNVCVKIQMRRALLVMEKNLVKITAEQVKQNQVLFTKFKDIIYEKVGASEFPEGNNVVAVYNEFSRKLCNTRINEFLDTFRQKAAAGEGKATILGQNLRDTLLTQHINLRSKSNK